MADPVSRRTLLALLPLGAVTLAGCSGGDGSRGATTTRPAGSAPTTSPSPSGSPSGSPSPSTPPSTPPSTTGSATSSPPTTTTAPPTTPAPRAAGTARGSVRVTRILATGVDVPWGLARLPDGSVLVSSRDSFTVTRVVPATGATTLLGRVPGVSSNASVGGEGGLLGLAVGPSYERDRLVFAYLSTTTDNRVVALAYDASRPPGRQLGPPRVLVAGIPHGVHHNGGRLGFGPDGMLYATTGESGVPSLSQDRRSLGGKVLRMTPAGAPAPGNPFGSLVWSYGHRNVQGIAWDGAGRLWASEFGDKAADELNLLTRGANYGWPATQGRTTVAGYTSPVAQWGTDEDSPSGIAHAAGCVWMAALKGQRLWRIPLDGTRVVAAPTAFLTGTYGRLRSVLALDDRTLLLTTSNRDGRVSPRAGDDRLLVLAVS